MCTESSPNQLQEHSSGAVTLDVTAPVKLKPKLRETERRGNVGPDTGLQL